MLGDNVYIDLPRKGGPLHRYTYVPAPVAARVPPAHVSSVARVCHLGRSRRGHRRCLARPLPRQAELEAVDADRCSKGELEQPGLRRCGVARLAGSSSQSATSISSCSIAATIAPIHSRTRTDHARPGAKEMAARRIKAVHGEFKVIAQASRGRSEPSRAAAIRGMDFLRSARKYFRAIEKNTIDGVVLLSADRHRSEAWKIPRPNAYPLYDL